MLISTQVGPLLALLDRASASTAVSPLAVGSSASTLLEVQRRNYVFQDMERGEHAPSSYSSSPPTSSSTSSFTGTIVIQEDIVKYSGVRCYLPGSFKQVAANVSFQVNAGGGIANAMLIMGPSGCGKSSLLRLLSGLWVSFDGTITRPSLPNLLFLSQRPYLVHGTLREQVLYPKEDDGSVSDARIEAALEKVGLSDLVSRAVGCGVTGAQQELGFQVLSPGEQQKLGLARVFLQRPAFAILDEATSAIDEATEGAIMQQLLETGTSLISVSQRSTLLKYHSMILRRDHHHMWTLGSLL
jgi:putative ATP-binding cassette transporter